MNCNRELKFVLWASKIWINKLKNCGKLYWLHCIANTHITYTILTLYISKKNNIQNAFVSQMHVPSTYTFVNLKICIICLCMYCNQFIEFTIFQIEKFHSTNMPSDKVYFFIEYKITQSNHVDCNCFVLVFFMYSAIQCLLIRYIVANLQL